MKVLKIRPIVEGSVEGEAIVSPVPISFLGGVDAETGAIIDSENPLFGEIITGKIFVFPESKGSTVGSYVIYGLSVNNVAPLAFVANEAETIVVAGAILANIPFVDRADQDVILSVKTGDILEINTTEKTIKIKKKK
jgi:predicted aconitase with swiveling domain